MQVVSSCWLVHNLFRRHFSVFNPSENQWRNRFVYKAEHHVQRRLSILSNHIPTTINVFEILRTTYLLMHERWKNYLILRSGTTIPSMIKKSFHQSPPDALVKIKITLVSTINVARPLWINYRDTRNPNRDFPYNTSIKFLF